jgi:hypothetical protein
MWTWWLFAMQCERLSCGSSGMVQLKKTSNKCLTHLLRIFEAMVVGGDDSNESDE